MLGATIHFYVEFLKKLPCEQVKVFFSDRINSSSNVLPGRNHIYALVGIVIKRDDSDCSAYWTNSV